MAELKDFIKTQTASLSDFVSQVSTRPVWSRPSAQNFAAHASLMSDRPVETYDRVMSEMQNMGMSPTQDAYLNNIKQVGIEQAGKAFLDFIADTEVSFEDKQAATVGFQTFQQREPNHHIDLATQAAIEPMRNETESSERFRINSTTTLQQVNEQRHVQAMMLNEAISELDQGILGNVADFAQFLLPFLPQRPAGNISEELQESGGIETFVFNGEVKAELANLINQVPTEQRGQMIESILNVVNEHGGTILLTNNNLAQVDMLRTMLEDGYYQDEDQMVDNMVSLIETTGIGLTLSRALGFGKGVKSGYSALKHMVMRDSVKAPINPTSASQALKDTNPDKYRELFWAVRSDESGEVAEAAYGAARVDAIGHDIMTEILQPFDVVKNKVDIPIVDGVRARQPDARVIDAASTNGAIYLTEADKMNIKSAVVNDFRDAFGLQPRTAMTRAGSVDGVTGEILGDTTTIRAVYGSIDGGFDNVADAIETTKMSLRQYGIVDDDIKILLRDGEHYTPVPAAVVNRQIGRSVMPRGERGRFRAKTEEEKLLDDFLIQVDFKHKGTLEQTPLETFDVKNNFFDRFSATTGNRQGSLTRHFVDLSSLLRSELSLGANRAVDRGAQLQREMLELGKKFTDVFETLNPVRKTALYEEIKRANFEGRMPDRARLMAEGGNADELKALDRWKEYWDTHWYLENQDKMKSMKARGYQVIENNQGDLFFGKPISREAAVRRSYDPDTGEIVTLTRQELDDLYANGGHLSKAQDEMRIAEDLVGGEEGLPIIVRNQSGGTTSRGFRDWDEVLNYREGYFSVRYETPYFVVKTMTKPDGTTYERAVATSGDFKSAQRAMDQLASKDGGQYRVRSDLKGEQLERSYDEVNVAGGRSAQRSRGQRLEDATDATNDKFDHQFVMNPVDSLIASARGISERIAMRDFMEASKSRFIQQFNDMLPKNKFGETMFPSNISQIGKPGAIADARLADARTTFEALKYWEDGYINAIDDGYRAIMREIAQVAGMAGWTRAEKLAHLASRNNGPLGFSKQMAFNLYLVLNPLRQVIIQAHQAVQLAAKMPGYVATRLAPDMTVLVAARLANGVDDIDPGLLKWLGRSKEEAREIYEGYMNSGLSAAIDRQNLTRGSLLSFADDIAYKGAAQGGAMKLGRGVGKVLAASRRVGFDFGEEVNMMSSFLAHLNEAKAAKGGAKLNVEEMDLVVAKARDFTYNMNRAGDMPYNQNWLSMAMQFAQVPHKALLQFTTSRTMSKMDKLRIGTFNLAMYGVPPGAILYPYMDKMLVNAPEDVREAAIYGLESYMLNNLASAIYGEETRLYFGGLQAVDNAHLYEMMVSLATVAPMEVLANSPSGSLMFGQNPRIAEFARSVGKLTGMVREDSSDPTTLPGLIHQFAGLSSGYSNAYKAIMAKRLGEKRNVNGRVTADNISLPVAIGIAFGFETQAEMRNRYVTMDMYEQSKSFEDDVRNTWRLTKQQMTRVGRDYTNPDDALNEINFLWTAFEGSPRAMEILRAEISRDIRAGEVDVWTRMLKFGAGGVVDPDQIRHWARTLPDGPLKQQYTQILDDLDNLRQEDN